MLKIGILLGDDIGPEVVPECVKVMNPQQYDVVATTNLFGDILTDEGAGR